MVGPDDAPLCAVPATFGACVAAFAQGADQLENAFGMVAASRGMEPLNWLFDQYPALALAFQPASDAAVLACELQAERIVLAWQHWRMEYFATHGGNAAAAAWAMAPAAGAGGFLGWMEGKDEWGGSGAGGSVKGPTVGGTNSVEPAQRQLTDEGRTVGGIDPVEHARNAKGGSNARGAAGQEALEALYGSGGAPERFVTRSGDIRDVDYVIRRGGRIYAYEAKNNASRPVHGRPYREIEEIRKDVILRQEQPGYTPIWVFFDKGPGSTLKGELQRNNILYIEYR